MFLSPGISDSERQRRKESNKISTKINFFAWTIEANKTIVIYNLSLKRFFPIVCWPSYHGAGFFIVLATHSQQELKI